MYSEIQKIKNFPDYYSALNLPFGSSRDLIKNYYYTLAKIFHPDNKQTGQREKFEEIHKAYQILSSDNREQYDKVYIKVYTLKKKLSKEKETVLLSQDRIQYTTSINRLAKRGLLKTGLRKKDRSKYTGEKHDIDLIIFKSEIGKRILVKVPLVVRLLCPSCFGSDIHCESCSGIGTYKGTRLLQISFEPEQIVNNRIYEFELNRLRPEKFIHFKKKKFRIKIELH